MNSGRRAIAGAGLALVAVALTGCGFVPGLGPDPRIDATPVAAVVCPETYEDGYAVGGLVPDGFDAVAVVRCDPYAVDAVGDGAGVLRERLTGDLQPVLEALAHPSDPHSLGACTAVGYLLPELWLESVDGSFVRLAIPSTGCGAPKDVGLDAALAALHVDESEYVPVPPRE